MNCPCLPRVEDLRALTREEVIAECDYAAGHLREHDVWDPALTQYWLVELGRGDLEHHNRKLTKLTWAIVWMTATITVATIVNVVLFMLEGYERRSTTAGRRGRWV